MKKFLIIDQNIIFRSAISSLITSHDETFSVVECDTIDNAIKLIEYYKTFHVVIFTIHDLNNSNQLIEIIMNKLEASRRIAVFQDTTLSISELQSWNVDGALSIASTNQDFINAIRAVLCDEKFVCNSLLITNDLKNNLKKKSGSDQEISNKTRLTIRQKEVLKYITSGYANKLIAYELGVTEGTIKLHVSSILKTLNVTNRTEAAMKAGRMYDIHAY